MIVIKRLVWDEWNVGHIARHGVVATEVEEVCHGNPLVQQGNKGRIVIVGPTLPGKILEVVLDPETENGVYYVVTAHVASRKDRALYKKERGGESV